MKIRSALVMIALAAFVTGTAQGQSMVGQDHDFSGETWADGEICKPCHTPHHTLTDPDSGVPLAYLWNHTLTTATYTLYDGTTADAGPDDGTAAFDYLSRLCMGCHDGTVAIDSFGGAVGTDLISGNELVGTDLRDDHPVGSVAIYPTGSTSFQTPTADHKLGPGGELKLRSMQIDDGAGGSTTEYVVGCMSCHTPHYKGFDKQLRMTNDASAMCLSCHIK